MTNRIGFQLPGAESPQPSTVSIARRIGRKLDDLPIGRAAGVAKDMFMMFTAQRLLGWELGVGEITTLSYTAYASFGVIAAAAVAFWEMGRARGG